MDPFVSYAQNFEDVMLWRALKHVQQGFYVDVGANDPKIESVTLAFYERGWRGINIEPMHDYYEALCRMRPEDINLELAVAASTGEITLYEVPETGLTSAISKFAENAQVIGKGSAVIERKVKAMSLNHILEEHARQPVHFLKIDVEGFEEDVLRGLDLERWRPWIIVVEATLPNSSEVSYASWEPMLLSGGYKFVYFDGLNRFYVADEHVELLPSFAAPPNFFDHFITYQHAAAFEQISWQESVIKSHLSTIKDREFLITERESVIANQKVKLEELQKETARLSTEIAQTRKECDWLRNEWNASRNEAEDMQRQYINILYSKSYQITAPLRAFYGLLDGLRKNAPVVAVSQAQKALATQTEIQNDFNCDEKYFLNFFQREIGKRRSAKQGMEDEAAS